MSLISMAVNDTEANKRSDYTNRTINSLLETVDFTKHRLFISDNESSARTKGILGRLEKFHWRSYGFPKENLQIIYNDTNLGTAEAINKCWQNRRIGEHCVKIDNDVVIAQSGWVEQLEEAIRRDETIGLCALKRKDLEQRPDHPSDTFKSELIMLPHDKGQPWIIVEQCADIMGTCVMHSSNLLDKIGYLYQPGKYGFDDVLASVRSTLAGFKNVFIPYIEIDHIDTGGTMYAKWKERHAHEHWSDIGKIIAEYKSGERSIYYSPFQTT